MTGEVMDKNKDKKHVYWFCALDENAWHFYTLLFWCFLSKCFERILSVM